MSFSSLPGDLERLAYGEPDKSYCKHRDKMSDSKARTRG